MALPFFRSLHRPSAPAALEPASRRPSLPLASLFLAGPSALFAKMHSTVALAALVAFSGSALASYGRYPCNLINTDGTISADQSQCAASALITPGGGLKGSLSDPVNSICVQDQINLDYACVRAHPDHPSSRAAADVLSFAQLRHLGRGLHHGRQLRRRHLQQRCLHRCSGHDLQRQRQQLPRLRLLHRPPRRSDPVGHLRWYRGLLLRPGSRERLHGRPRHRRCARQ